MREISRYSTLLLAVLGVALYLNLSGCDSTKPEEDAGEEELVTRVVMSLTSGGTTSTITANDSDGDGQGITFSPNPLTLQAGQTYTGTIRIYNDIADEEVTAEIEEEASHHLFKYAAQGGLAGRVTITPTDKESDYEASDNNQQRDIPVGLAFNLVVSSGAAAAGTVNATLFHFDAGAVKSSGTSTSSERDIDIDFPISIQ